MAVYGLVVDGYMMKIVFFMLGCYGYGMYVLNSTVAPWYMEHGICDFDDEGDWFMVAHGHMIRVIVKT